MAKKTTENSIGDKFINHGSEGVETEGKVIRTMELNVQFAEIVGLIRQTHNSVLTLANRALIDLYWKVGCCLSSKIRSSEWGDGVVKQLADHIARSCPDIKGFSDKNLWRMKKFYETYASADEKLSALLRQVSWTNNLTLITRAKSDEERNFYLHLCANDHLSSRELDRQIDSALYERTKLQEPKLSPAMREIAPAAKNIFRDHYVMEFISGQEAKPENTLRRALISKMKKFILELGKDFIYIDEEYRFDDETGKKEVVGSHRN